MFLKRLELKGFKSFPEKTILEFNTGITAIVGPNGSGKSNISDAVRWVLGEQSVKNLRGSTKMEDVIFVGTQNRTKLGFAEVSMVIDNTDESFDLPYNEVVITRRLYRSGESEFAINGSFCRLKDIHELFMDTGIGREGYSIIGQGRIDEILSTKSEDRRTIFEEAVGIVKFKTRKLETEKKLEKERQNLIRVNDIISELETQIEPLEIQAEKTKKYLVLLDKLKLIQINLFLLEVNKIELQIEKNAQDIITINDEITKSEKETPLFEEKKKKLKLELEKISNELNTINSELIEFRSENEQTENDIKFVEQQIDYINQNIEDTTKEISSFERDIFLKNEQLKLKSSQKSASSIELKTKKDSLENIQKEFKTITSKLDEKEEIIEKYNFEIIEKMQLRSELKANIENLSSSISQVSNSYENLKNELDFSLSQKNDKEVRLLALKKSLQDIETEENNLKDELSQMQNEKAKNNDKLNDLYKNRENISKNLNDFSSRFRILSELEKDYEGYYESVKSILRQKEKNNPLFANVRGAVGELIDVEQRYEVAVETALGGSVQNIITKTEKDAGKVIEYLKQNKKGRATFLPMNAIKGKELEENLKSKILKETGVIDFAKKLIKYSSEYENIFSNLLGRVIVIDTFDNAVAFAQKYRYAYKLVTLGGELLNAGGSITGGSINKKTAGIFSRNREIKDLEQKISVYSLKLKEYDDNISKLKTDFGKIDDIIENINSSVHTIFLKKNELNNQIIQIENLLNSLVQKIELLTSQRGNLDTDISERKENLISIQNNFNETEEKISELQGYLNKYQKEIQSNKNIREETTKKVTELRLEVSEIEFKISSINSEIERINSEIKKQTEDIEKDKEKINTFNAEILSKEEEIKLLNQKIVSLQEKSESKQEEIKLLNQKQEQLNVDTESLEKEHLSHIEYISKINNEKTRLELSREQLEEKKTSICNDIWEKYEITIASAQRYEKLDKDQNKLRQDELKLKDEIRDIGTVNTDAIEEFKRVKERYDFLTSQKEDILYAEENLKNIISELLTLMENQFKEQFKIINENFGIVFSEIFGGGNGYIKLSDESNVLNSGIEIVAQPPGKSLQSMSLLSGGERALTAIALLFAILKMKPSPFCILDEIEAALDDANVKRYANYLKRFSDNTQFIVITHRKGSMEVADTLYGITMQEQGVSKLVSVRFTENESIVQ